MDTKNLSRLLIENFPKYWDVITIYLRYDYIHIDDDIMWIKKIKLDFPLIDTPTENVKKKYIEIYRNKNQSCDEYKNDLLNLINFCKRDNLRDYRVNGIDSIYNIIKLYPTKINSLFYFFYIFDHYVGTLPLFLNDDITLFKYFYNNGLNINTLDNNYKYFYNGNDNKFTILDKLLTLPEDYLKLSDEFTPNDGLEGIIVIDFLQRYFTKYKLENHSKFLKLIISE